MEGSGKGWHHFIGVDASRRNRSGGEERSAGDTGAKHIRGHFCYTSLSLSFQAISNSPLLELCRKIGWYFLNVDYR